MREWEMLQDEIPEKIVTALEVKLISVPGAILEAGRPKIRPTVRG